MFASTNVRAAVIREPRSSSLPPWCCRRHLWQTPTEKNQRGLYLVTVGVRRFVRRSQSSDLEIFHPEHFKRWRPNEGEHHPVEKWYQVAGLKSVERQILPTCSCKLLRSLYPPQRKTDPASYHGQGHITHWPLDCHICVQWPHGGFQRPRSSHCASSIYPLGPYTVQSICAVLAVFWAIGHSTG